MFKGNTVDTQTLLPQVRRVKAQFGIARLAIVGDRGMISQTQIDELKVKRAFRSIKTVDLKVRPIHHHLAPRVRAHIFFIVELRAACKVRSAAL